jgi:hypothetical protein
MSSNCVLSMPIPSPSITVAQQYTFLFWRKAVSTQSIWLARMTLCLKKSMHLRNISQVQTSFMPPRKRMVVIRTKSHLVQAHLGRPTYLQPLFNRHWLMLPIWVSTGLCPILWKPTVNLILGSLTISKLITTIVVCNRIFRFCAYVGSSCARTVTCSCL